MERRIISCLLPSLLPNLLLGYSLLLTGCYNEKNQNHIENRINGIQVISKDDKFKLQDRIEGVLIEVYDGNSRYEEKIARIKTINEIYTISIYNGKNNNSGLLSIEQLSKYSIGDIINFPTKEIIENGQENENYSEKEIFPNNSSDGRISLQEIRIKNNIQRDDYRIEIDKKK